jgi:DNA-3-methyladenine glycosylase
VSRAFYLRPAPTVARDLLGKYLARKIGRTTLVARIVEVEAYCQDDPASHSFRGMTKRNEVMFQQGGHLYVYFTYGMHFCANVVTGAPAKGEAVLLRAAEPISGIEYMVKKRSRAAKRTRRITFPLTDLLSGPAKLCQAFGIERSENGIDLLGDEIYLLDAPRLPASSIEVTSRIGIRVGTATEWRFLIKGNEWTSR